MFEVLNMLFVKSGKFDRLEDIKKYMGSMTIIVNKGSNWFVSFYWKKFQWDRNGPVIKEVCHHAWQISAV